MTIHGPVDCAYYNQHEKGNIKLTLALAGIKRTGRYLVFLRAGSKLLNICGAPQI